MVEKKDPDTPGSGAAGQDSPVEDTGRTWLAPGRKVTAEDLQAAMAARRVERRENPPSRSPLQTGKVVRTAVASVLGIGIIAASLALGTATDDHRAEVAANESTLNSLRGALESLPEPGNTEVAGSLEQDISAARARSDELAAAQSRFAAIAFAGNGEPQTNDGRPNPAVLRSLEHRRVLAGFFAPEAMVLSDADAYSFRTEDLLGQDDIDPRLPWYTRYTSEDAEQKAAAPDSYPWVTASVLPSGTPGVMEVVWTSSDTNTGELLAWATARYSVESGTFRNLTVQQTTRGESQSLQIGTAGPAPTPEERA